MKLKTPLVTVLISNYNYDRYLREAIDSVLNQTYPYIEVIVVDDGSTDNSRELITSYTNKIIPVFKENGGQGSAFNLGFEISNGEIICLLDSDDTWLPSKIECVVRAKSAFPNASCIYHKVQNIDQTGKLISKPWPPYKVIQGNISKKVVKTGGWWPFPPCTGLSFTRNFFSQVMNIPEECRHIADTYLADLAPFFGDIVGINQTLSLYRLHGMNNWSHPQDYNQRVIDTYELRTKVLNRVLQNSVMDMQVSLKNHLPYQRRKFKMGEKNFIELNQLVWQNPWELRTASRLKETCKHLLKMTKIRGNINQTERKKQIIEEE